MKPRVLIASDNRDLVEHIVEGYRSCGYEVVTGLRNFFWQSMDFDLVHLLWPEELSDWKPPTDTKLDTIKQTLISWNERSKTLLTVNNIAPHIEGDHPNNRALYHFFHTHTHAVYHHSEASRILAAERYSCAPDNHHVTTLFNYDSLLPGPSTPPATPADFGFDASDFVVLCFGALRNSDELELIRRAFDAASIPRKKLLMCGRSHLTERSRVQRLLKRTAWQRWLKKRKAHCQPGYIPDEEVHRYFQVAQAVIVPRSTSLSSGLVPMAMTFGTPIAAPDHGAYPDYLAGTDNPLYPSGSPEGLARALEKIAHLDPDLIARQCRTIADTCSWSQILTDILGCPELKIHS